jgi:hypothetical protein
MAGKLAAIIESYVRLVVEMQVRSRHTDPWDWMDGLVGGPKAVLHLVSQQQQQAGGKFDGSYLSCLCSLLRLAGSDLMPPDAASLRCVISSVINSAVAMLQRSLPADVAAADVAVAASASSSSAGVGRGVGVAGLTDDFGSGGGFDPEGGVGDLPPLVLFGRGCALYADVWKRLNVGLNDLTKDRGQFTGHFFKELKFSSQCQAVVRWLRVFAPQLTIAG